MGALEELRRDLQAAADPKKALVMQRFFKTGRGQCGEGDVFIGLTVPRPRLIAKKYSGLPLLQDIRSLPHSEVHEERLIALDPRAELRYAVERFQEQKRKAYMEGRAPAS